MGAQDFEEENLNTDGYRLDRAEVYNWGSYDGKVWIMPLYGQNGFLVGENGSGKSTLVDAITTLLVPQGKLVYNRAAGAKRDERTLLSYTLGYTGSHSEENSAEGVHTRLRGKNSYTVILLVFKNEQLRAQESPYADITLAQVMWPDDTKPRGVAVMYVAADADLSIKRDFSGFGRDMRNLRRKLRQSGAQVFDSFTPYSGWFRQRFGMSGSQAVDLFYQTQSMKSVSDITSFVQENMLEPFDADTPINALVDHFRDLTAAYEKVIRTREMRDGLKPICEETGARLMDTRGTISSVSALADCLPHYLGLKRQRLLEEAIAADRLSLEKVQGKIDHAKRLADEYRAKRESIQRSIMENGGSRLEGIATEIAACDREIAKVSHDRASYAALIKNLGGKLPDSEDAFIEQRAWIAAEKDAATAQSAKNLEDLVANGVEVKRTESEHAKLRADFDLLKSRQSNISADQLRIRSMLCRDLHLREKDLPFAGELMEVRDEEKPIWEGAIERVVHGLALSMLVPEERYGDVMRYVDGHFLKGRLVYFRVPERLNAREPQLPPRSLVSKIRLKPDSQFRDFLRDRLVRSFNYECCEDLASFAKSDMAMTPQGQVKAPNGRHEKDDRHDISDRSRYVLGWSNADKLALLLQMMEEKASAMKELKARSAMLRDQNKALTGRINAASILLSSAPSYSDICADERKRQREDLLKEKKAIEESSDILAKLRDDRDNVEKLIKDREKDIEDATGLKGRLEGQIQRNEGELSLQLNVLEDTKENWDEALAPKLDEEFKPYQPTYALPTAESVEKRMQRAFDQRLRDLREAAEKLSNQLTAQMSAFKSKYPPETSELDASEEALPGFADLLRRIEEDDIPRFEQDFKRRLRSTTIDSVANLSAKLLNHCDEIRRKIDIINGTLKGIDYDPGCHIQLDINNTNDIDIRDFRKELKECTSNTFSTHEEFYESEAKFKQIKNLVDRLAGRSASADTDQRWRAKVTDVRRWFTFAAEVISNEDGSQVTYLRDSGGISGGQKEKLAYTILAAALAYQYGTADNREGDPRTFRFVIIDEAFGRGSNALASYGLDLFRRMHLQVLIATPLSKIGVMERFVQHVCLATMNKATKRTSLLTMTIEEFRRRQDEQQARRLALAKAKLLIAKGKFDPSELQAALEAASGQDAQDGAAAQEGSGTASEAQAPDEDSGSTGASATDGAAPGTVPVDEGLDGDGASRPGDDETDQAQGQDAGSASSMDGDAADGGAKAASAAGQDESLGMDALDDESLEHGGKYIIEDDEAEIADSDDAAALSGADAQGGEPGVAQKPGAGAAAPKPDPVQKKTASHDSTAASTSLMKALGDIMDMAKEREHGSK